MYYLVIFVIFVLLLLFKRYQASIKGSVGEKLTKNKLNISRMLGREGEILNNVYIPKANGETSEIDLLYITKKGIFVIESKNYSGYIFGSEQNQYWTSTLYARSRREVEKYQFYNPIKQNRTHIKNLKEYLGYDVPCFSIIVFSDRCSFKNINLFSNDVFVCHRSHINRIISEIWEKSEDALTDNDVFNIKVDLEKNVKVDQDTKELHIKQIRDKYYDNVCPLCGGKLVLRQAKHGQNAGNSFYGCSNYPQCKYIKNIDN